MEVENEFEEETTELRTSRPSVELNEVQIVAEAKGGSRPAFEQLVERYGQRVFGVAQAIMHNREDAEEVMQNAFVQAFKNLYRFRGDSRFYTWLVRITINEGLMRVRRRRLIQISIDDSVETDERALPRELQDCEPTPEQRYSQEELRSILATTIGELPARYRDVFQLRDIEGFSTKETAHALDLSATAVKTRLRRARVRLRGSLNKRLKAVERTRTRMDGVPRNRGHVPNFNAAPIRTGAGGCSEQRTSRV